MERFTRYIIGMMLAVLLLGSMAVSFVSMNETAYAQEDTQPGQPGDGTRPQRPGEDQRPQHPGRGPGGEVTAINATTITLLTPRDETVVISTTAETEVILLASQTEGSLNDIAVGDMVRVKGRPDAAGNITAEAIVVAPEGERAGGRVTAVEGTTITVENRDGTQPITTDDTTIIRQGEEHVGLDAISVDMGVDAFGSLQDDGTLQATLVLIHERRDGPPPQGEGQPGNEEEPGRPGRPGQDVQPGEGERPGRPGQPGNDMPPADENGTPDQRPAPDADAEAPAAPDNTDETSPDNTDEVYAEDGEVRDDTTYFSIDQQQNGLVVFLPLMHG